MEEKMKYLEIIQNVISRMASNSFALKGWAVALVSGVFVLSSKDSNALYFLIAYVPIVFFGCLIHIISFKNVCIDHYIATQKKDIKNLLI